MPLLQLRTYLVIALAGCAPQIMCPAARDDVLLTLRAESSGPRVALGTVGVESDGSWVHTVL